MKFKIGLQIARYWKEEGDSIRCNISKTGFYSSYRLKAVLAEFGAVFMAPFGGFAR